MLDALVSQPDQVLDGCGRPGDLVDADAQRCTRQVALDDDDGYVMLLEDLEASGCRFPRPDDSDVIAVVESIVEELARLNVTWDVDDVGAEIAPDDRAQNRSADTTAGVPS